jgi:hypothetical protein
MKHNCKDYISFPKGYNDFISLGFGKCTDLKPSELGLKWEIIHNLPLQAYNYEYKTSVPLSLCTILLNTKLIEQSVDIVMPSFNIRNGYPREITKTDVIVHSKKDLFNAVMSNKKEIYVVIPKSKPSAKEESDFYRNMVDYFNEFIIPFVKRKSLSTFRRILKVL